MEQNDHRCKLIVLNSKDGDRLNGEYLSRVRFNFRDILKEDDIYLLALIQRRSSYKFYKYKYNNQFYEVNGVNYTLTIPEKENYNATPFIAQFISLYNGEVSR
jgi:hypothetical protein